MSTDQTTPNGGVLSPGTLLGNRFRIEAVLGIGGMATVYRARDESLGRVVAVKLFRAETASADDLRRQRDEISLLASLNAPGLVTLFDAVAEDLPGGPGRAFLVLELVEGTDLHTRLGESAVSPALAARIGSDVASALAYIHSRGVVHRDVKPGNILLPVIDPDHPGPTAKLTDFGIARLVDDARLTVTGTVIGTASYLSPEQATGAAVGPESDVYSLGLVLMEALTGTRAFTGSAIESISAKLARDPLIPTEFGAAWTTLLTAMTRREPGARPTAAEAAAALRDLAAGTASSGAAAGAVGMAQTMVLPVEDPTLAYDAATPADAATRVFEAPAAATRVFEAPIAATTSGQAGQDATTPPRRRWGWLIAVVAALAIIGVVAAIALSMRPTSIADPSNTPTSLPSPSQTPTPTPTPTPTVEPIVYPPVAGTLGDDLAILQSSVASDPAESSADYSPATAAILQAEVLAISQSAADEDFQTALDQLRSLAATVDELNRDGELTDARANEISDAIRSVRDDLESAIQDQNGGGKDNKPGKGNGNNGG